MNHIQETVELNNNVKMPYFGLGLYKAGEGQKTRDAIQWAFDSGYRLFDTAQIYGNEIETGEAIKNLDIDRSEVFVTSKVWTSNFGYKETITSVKESLDKLEMEYVDLFLLHWPVVGKRLEAYKALEFLHKEGYLRAIGVSNFTIKHLQELLNSCEIKPAVNQVEYHPWLYQHELRDYCQSNEIIFQAYSPFAKGAKVNDPAIQKIAEKYGKTIPQVLVRWSLEQNVSVIPKSSKKERIEENASVFDFIISDEDMNYLNSLDEHFHCTWDPCDVE